LRNGPFRPRVDAVPDNLLPLDYLREVIKGLDALVRDQIMAMKTTFTPGHYRRRVASVLARRLVQNCSMTRKVPLEHMPITAPLS